jgi:hypothetical protein
MSWPYRIVPGEQTDAAIAVPAAAAGRRGQSMAGLKLIAEAGLQAQTTRWAMRRST